MHNSNSRDEQNPRGEVPEPSELVTTGLSIAGYAVRLHKRAAAQQNEVMRALRGLEDAREDMRKTGARIEEQADVLHRMYAPNAVQVAAAESRKAVADFRREAAGIADQLKRQLDAATRPLSLRIIGIAVMPAVVTVIGLLCVVGFARYYVPPLNEVQERRSVLAQQPGHFISPDGRQWVQIGEVKAFCKNLDQSQCARYGLVE